VGNRRSGNSRAGARWLKRIALLLLVAAAGYGTLVYLGQAPWPPPQLDELLASHQENPDVAARRPPPALAPTPESKNDVGTSREAALDRLEPAPSVLEPERSIELPQLSESDAILRDFAAPLDSHPLAKRVLNQPDLIQTFVTAALEVAEGRSPQQRFEYLAPKGQFKVRGDLLYLRIDPASYARYTPLVDALSALDASALVRVYTRLEPLFDQAYAELGYPGEDFDDTFRAALDVLLAVPELDRAPALIPRAKTYAYEDPELEALAPAQRQLLRMGPANVERTKRKLRELKALLEARNGAPEAGTGSGF